MSQLPSPLQLHTPPGVGHWSPFAALSQSPPPLQPQLPPGRQTPPLAEPLQSPSPPQPQVPPLHIDPSGELEQSTQMAPVMAQVMSEMTWHCWLESQQPLHCAPPAHEEPQVWSDWQAWPDGQSPAPLQPQAVPFTQPVPLGLPVQSAQLPGIPQLVVVPRQAPGASAATTSLPVSAVDVSPAVESTAPSPLPGPSCAASGPPLLPLLLPPLLPLLLPPDELPPVTSASEPLSPGTAPSPC